MIEAEHARLERLGARLAESAWRFLPQLRDRCAVVALRDAHTYAETPIECQCSDVFAAAFMTQWSALWAANMTEYRHLNRGARP